jgi:hypothetical protein
MGWVAVELARLVRRDLLGIGQTADPAISDV